MLNLHFPELNVSFYLELYLILNNLQSTFYDLKMSCVCNIIIKWKSMGHYLYVQYVKHKTMN